MTAVERRYATLIKKEQASGKDCETEINRLIEHKYGEIREELDQYAIAQKDNFKGLEGIIEVTHFWNYYV